MKNKLLEIISKQCLENLLFVEKLHIKEIARMYNVSCSTIKRLRDLYNITFTPINKLLCIITKETLYKLLWEDFMTPMAIARLYNVVPAVVTRAIEICGIELDPDIWRSGSSYSQKLLISKNIHLTDEQHQIIVGSLLGDGQMTVPSGHGFSMFTISQREACKEYVTDLHSRLIPFSNNISTATYRVKQTGNTFVSYYFNTTRCLEFTEYRQQFYPNGKKIVPKNIYELLDPVAIAHWYLQDGVQDCRKRNSQLCTNGFTTEDVELLIDVLDKKFSIKSHLIYHEKPTKYPMIYIGAREGYDTLHDIVDPYITYNCFSYKLSKGRKVIKKYVSKLTENAVKEIRKLHSEGLKYKELALKYGVAKQTIQSIVLRKTFGNIE